MGCYQCSHRYHNHSHDRIVCLFTEMGGRGLNSRFCKGIENSYWKGVVAMPITYNATKRLWILEPQNTGYAAGISGDGHIKHTSRGARITRTKDYPDLSEPQKNPWWDRNDEFPVRGE